MKRWTTILRLVLFVVLAILLWVCSSPAQVHLSFAPADTTLAPGQSGRLSIMVADTLEYRTIDVTVTYDTTIVRSLGGAEGRLYSDSGIYTFAGFEEDTLGTWHGYAVLMGSGLFIKGPGEMYYWDFEGLAEGVSPVVAVTAYVSTTDGSWFQDVTLPPTTITVNDPLSAVSQVPCRGPELRLMPNPFNPRTRIFFDLDRAGRVELAVYDIQGHRVADLYDGHAPAGLFTGSWDGFDSEGRALPGGVYLFSLKSPAGRSVAKGVLVK